MKIGITVGVVIAILALVVCLVPLKEVVYTATVDYQDTETYYEDEPYEDSETYYIEIPLDYEVVDSYVRQVKGTETFIIGIGGHESKQTRVGYLDIACVKVKNIDMVEGTFWVSISVDKPTFGWINPDPEGNADMFPEGKLNLAPSETGIRQCAADELGQWSYSVSASTKKVEKQRTVTKYRQVEKERTVTKHRPETRYKKVTLLDYLLHY